MLKTLAHLLPNSPLWSLAIERPLTRLFAGVADFFDDSRDILDRALLEFWPEYTTDPIGHLVRLGFSLPDIRHLSTERARTLLIAVQRKSRGMDPGRLQDLLQSAGFPLYVHEWWASSDPWVERDPTDYMIRPLIGPNRCGMPSVRCGVPSARCSYQLLNNPNYIVNQTLRRIPPPWLTEAGYRGVFYLSSATFPEPAIIAEADRPLLDFMILRYKRAILWAVLLIEYEGTQGGLILTEGGDSILTEGGDAILSE